MDSKRPTPTPPPNQIRGGINTKPASSSSSRFLKPRSAKKHDANSTFLGFNSTIMNSSRMLNTTTFRNMDVTISGSSASTPWIKSGMSQASNDLELEYDLIYNRYLQAKIKQQLVKKDTEEHGRQLNDQVLIQCENLHKLKNSFMDISNRIEAFQEQSVIVEFLQRFKFNVSEMETFYTRYNTLDHLNNLSTILIKESNLVSLRNIKPIESQEEYDQLILTLDKLKRVLEHIMKLYKNFEEIHELACAIKSFVGSNKNAILIAQKVFEINKKAAATFLASASDMFAQAGEY